MTRHSKTVNLHLEGEAQYEPREAGPSCKKCHHCETVRAHAPKWRLACTRGHDLEPAACLDFKDASIASPLTLGGTLGSFAGRVGA